MSSKALLGLLALPVLLLIALRTTADVGRANGQPRAAPQLSFQVDAVDGSADGSVDATPGSPLSGTGSLLQLTDIHMDAHYIGGSTLKSHCHRSETSSRLYQRKSNAPHKLAGEIAARGCDASEEMVDGMFASVRELVATGDVDAVLWTGDNARHDNDKELPRTFEEILNMNHAVAQKMLATFNDSSNTIIIPSIGNNDIHPHNFFTEESGRAVLNGLADCWKPFLQPSHSELLSIDSHESILSRSPLETFLEHGFYFRRVSSTLSVVSLNTLLFFNENEDESSSCTHFFSPARKQITWLRDVLHAIERVQERTSTPQKVVFSGHIAPARLLYTPSCYDAYHDLARQFAPLIAMHVFGHTNFDYFEAIYEETAGVNNASSTKVALPKRKRSPDSGLRAIGAMFTAPPVVPDFNPAYRLYEYDRETGNMLDYHQYHARITDINNDHAVHFSRSYSFNQAYGTTSLAPSQVQLARERLTTDHQLGLDFLQRMISFDQRWADRILGNTDVDGSWRNKKKWRKMVELFCNEPSAVSYEEGDRCRQLFFP
jgi:hypothetical protein